MAMISSNVLIRGFLNYRLVLLREPVRATNCIQESHLISHHVHRCTHECMNMHAREVHLRCFGLVWEIGEAESRKIDTDVSGADCIEAGQLYDQYRDTEETPAQPTEAFIFHSLIHQSRRLNPTFYQLTNPPSNRKFTRPYTWHIISDIWYYASPKISCLVVSLRVAL